jgi:hypothetical protein
LFFFCLLQYHIYIVTQNTPCEKNIRNQNRMDKVSSLSVRTHVWLTLLSHCTSTLLPPPVSIMLKRSINRNDTMLLLLLLYDIICTLYLFAPSDSIISHSTTESIMLRKEVKHRFPSSITRLCSPLLFYWLACMLCTRVQQTLTRQGKARQGNINCTTCFMEIKTMQIVCHSLIMFVRAAYYYFTGLYGKVTNDAGVITRVLKDCLSRDSTSCFAAGKEISTKMLHWGVESSSMRCP